MIELQALKERYREHLAVLNYSPGTIRLHLFYLNRFFLYLENASIPDAPSVTRDTVRDYQRHLFEELNRRGEPNSVRSQNNALKVVRAFFRFLCENDYIVGNPARDVAYAKAPKRLPRSVLTQAEVKKLLHAPDTKTALGYRDRTILEVFYSSGIRRAELTNVLLEDLDYSGGFLRVNSGKGKKDRVVPVGKIACRYLENYIKAVRPSFLKDPHNSNVFLSLRGKAISKNTVWEIVKRCCRAARIKKSVSPHSLRHTFATLLLRNRANIRHIQEMLGHASLDSTQVYTAVSIADLKEVHSRCHPREKDKE
jgi:integrase/recombinase XerD